MEALDHPVSEMKNFESWSSLALVLTFDPLGRACFDPHGHHMNNLVEVHQEMLHTKYQSSRPSSFKKEESENGLISSYIPTCDNQGKASFEPGSII